MTNFVSSVTMGLVRRTGRIGSAMSVLIAAVSLGVVATSAAEAQVTWKPSYGGGTSYDEGNAAPKAYYPQKKSYAASSKKKSSGGVKVAALGGGSYDYKPKKPSITGGGGVKWVANAGCLDGSLKSVIYQVASNYGPVTVSSTCRSKSHNSRVGGAPRSKHLSGDAADFRVHSNVSATYAYLKSSGTVGGLKHYGGGLFHIDNGDRRSW